MHQKNEEVQVYEERDMDEFLQSNLNIAAICMIYLYIYQLMLRYYIEQAYLYRVHTGPGNREKVGDFKQAFSRPGIAGKLSILGDWSGNRREF